MARRQKAKRRLGIETLENRRVMAVFTVDTRVDESDGDFSAGDFSLREAIERANLTTASDRIDFRPGMRGSIVLQGSELSITSSMVINGPGADRITIDAHDLSRVIKVNTPAAVAIRGLTVQDGRDSSGGGISAVDSLLTLNSVHVTSNVANSGQGGGIKALRTRLTIINSTISNNLAALRAYGVTGEGGGLYHYDAPSEDGEPTLRVINSTITGNESGSNGGGLFVHRDVVLVNSTIVDNHAGGFRSAEGGGMYVQPQASGAIPSMHNSIVGGNKTQDLESDIEGLNVATLSSHNLIGAATTSGGLTNGERGNLVGFPNFMSARVIDRNFGLHGGSMPTHRLTLRSPALDAGRNVLTLDANNRPLATDQRGFERFSNRDDDPARIVDIGAYETSGLTITNIGDVTFIENGSPVLLAANAQVASEYVKTLTVQASTHAPGDRITIRNQGQEPGQIGLNNFNSITYSGSAFASIRSEPSDSVLEISMYSHVESEEIEALIRNILYRSDSENPTTRFIDFTLVGFDDVTNDPARVQVNVVASNDAPALTNFGGDVGYLQGNPPTLIARSAVVVEPDSPNLAGGQLRVQLAANASAGDRLQIQRRGDIATRDNKVFFAGEIIGTFSGGNGAIPLVINFNFRASPLRVQALLRSLAFVNTSSDPGGVPRTLSLRLSDGDGGTSINYTKRINVVPE